MFIVIRWGKVSLFNYRVWMLSCAKITGLSKLRTQKLGLRLEKRQCREGDPPNLQVNCAQMLRKSLNQVCVVDKPSSYVGVLQDSWMMIWKTDILVNDLLVVHNHFFFLQDHIKLIFLFCISPLFYIILYGQKIYFNVYNFHHYCYYNQQNCIR